MDPVLVQVIQLLQSTAKNSTEQLRAVLEETIKQRYGDSKSLAPLNIIKDLSKKELIPKPSSSSSSSSGRKDGRSSEKKPRLEPVVEQVESAPRVRSPDVVKSKPTNIREPEVVKEVPTPMQIDNDDDDDDDDDDDLALEILEDDLSCVVCRSISVGASNQLVECLECHSLYHQECHQPPVAKADINDPRWAWYCATCTKVINKQPKSRSSPKTVSSSSQPSSLTSTKPSQKAVAETVQNLFKRQDSKGSSSSSSKTQITSPSSMGMAGLAASYQPTSAATSSSSSSKSASSSSSSSKVVPPKVVTTVISADKRLANMKKKAAKQQEKRKHIK